jgi:hypothetical protein
MIFRGIAIYCLVQDDARSALGWLAVSCLCSAAFALARFLKALDAEVSA